MVMIDATHLRTHRTASSLAVQKGGADSKVEQYLDMNCSQPWSRNHRMRYLRLLDRLPDRDRTRLQSDRANFDIRLRRCLWDADMENSPHSGFGQSVAQIA